MPQAPFQEVLQYLRKTCAVQEARDQPDGVLLERFNAHQDEAAFAALVQRHGPMVLAVCRRVLGDLHAAEDGFQATFLVLVRRAASIGKREPLGGWLYAVAQRIALKAKARASKRRDRERRIDPMLRADTLDEVTWQELRSVLDEEIGRLPAKYRTPIVLCYLQGKSHDQAAKELGCPRTSLTNRLGRGRELLRQQLVKRGVTLSAAVLTTALCEKTIAAPLGAMLTIKTAKAAASIAAGKAAAGACLSARAIALAEEAITGMIGMKGKLALIVLAVGLTAGGTGLAGFGGVTENEQPLEMTAQAQPAKTVKSKEEQKKPVPGTDLYGDPLPDGAIARLGTQRFRTNGTFVGFLADSKTVLTATKNMDGSTDKGIQFWDAFTGKLLKSIALDVDHVRGSALSADGALLALAVSLPEKKDKSNPGAILVFDVATGKQIRAFPRVDKVFDHRSMAISSNGKLLMSIGDDCIVRVEDIKSGVETLRREFPKDYGPTLALSPDDSTLAVSIGSNGRQLFLWSWQSNGEPRELTSRRQPGHDFIFSPDSKTLLERSESHNELRVWDVAQSKLTRTVQAPEKSDRFGYTTYTPDGKSVVISSINYMDPEVRLWDVATWEPKKRLSSFVIGKPCVSPDGKLLSGSSSGGFWVWDLAGGKEISANDKAHRAEISDIAVSGKLLVTEGGDYTIRLWDATNCRHLLKFEHGYRVQAISLSPDGSKIVSSSFDDTVCLWDSLTGEMIHKLPGHGPTGGRRAVAFTPDGKHFLSWGDDMYLRKWETATGKRLLEKRIQPTGMSIPEKEDAGRPRDLQKQMLSIGNGKFSANGKLFVLDTQSRIHFFDVETGKDMYQLPKEDGLRGSIAISPDGRLLLAGGGVKRVAIQMADGTMGSSFAKETPLSLWELATRQVRKTVMIPDRGNSPVAFSPDGKLFAAATNGAESCIRVWQSSNGRELSPIKGYLGAVRSLAFTPDGTRLISGMDDTTALVWDLARKR